MKNVGYKHKLLVLCALILNSLTVCGQGRNAKDSLTALARENISDSLKFRVYDELAWIHRRTDANAALGWADSAVMFAKRTGNLKANAVALSNRGIIKNETNLNDHGLEDSRLAVELYTQLADTSGMARCLTNMAGAAESMSKYEEGIKYAQDAITLSKLSNNERQLAISLNQLGLLYQAMNQFDIAIKYFDEAIAVFPPASNSNFPRSVANNVGLTYLGRHQFEEALKYFMRAVEGLKPASDPDPFARIYGNFAICFWRMKQYDSAIYYAKASIELKKQIGNTNSISFPAATLSKVYRELGQYRESVIYAEMAIDYAESSGSLKNMMEGYENKAKTAYQAGNYKDAALAFERTFLLSDSLSKLSSQEAIAEMDAKYQVEKAKNEAVTLAKQNELDKATIKLQQYLIAVVGLVGFLFIALATIYYRNARAKQKLIKQIQAQHLQIKEQSEKLQTLDLLKSNFFANISHDLRSPLTLLLGNIDLVLEDNQSKLSKEAREKLNGSYRNGKKLLFMADEIRDLTRLQEGKLVLKPRPVRIQGYLSLLVKMFSSAATIKNIQLYFTAENNTDKVASLDPHQFEKVIYNLLANAVKHTPDGGEIFVSLAQGSGEQQLIIRVSDTGAGISAKHIDHIFDRYYQVPGEAIGDAVGLGIGLALCKEIVELHNGNISVESTESKGTTFSISMTYDANASLSTAIVDEYYDPTYTPLGLEIEGVIETKFIPNACNILVVEDHREIRNYLSALLNDEYNILIATNGEEALEILDKSNIHLIISDLMMPLMDGFELVKQLKDNPSFNQIPVLIVSARTNEEDRLQVLTLGADEVLPKPFTNKELKLRIKNLLEKSADNKLLQLYEPNNSQSGLEELVRQKIENLILERIDDPNLSVLDFTEILAASERKVFRLVKKIFNQTPLDLIKEVRWKYLETLLKNKKLTATEAAKSIGIANVTYFKRQFEDRFGKEFI